MKKIWAIILAAGESKRMGTPKMLLDFDGKTMLERVIENLLDSDISDILVVIGAEKEKIINILTKLPVHYCYNDNYKDGMLSSVKCGFSNLPSVSDSILVFQGDQPYIYADTINQVIKAYDSCDKGIVIPAYNGRRGHPLMIGSRYRSEIEFLEPDKGLRSLAIKFSDDVLEVEVNDPGILKDFDTYAEYKNEINQKL